MPELQIVPVRGSLGLRRIGPSLKLTMLSILSLSSVDMFSALVYGLADAKRIVLLFEKRSLADSFKCAYMESLFAAFLLISTLRTVWSKISPFELF